MRSSGLYKGIKECIIVSWIEMPSMGIYSYEFFNSFDVENIIRIGSMGSIREDLNLKDIVVATKYLNKFL